MHFYTALPRALVMMCLGIIDAMPSLDKQPARIQDMFSHIARRYDLMNRLMTAGQDVRWRREVIRLAAPGTGDFVLDLGAGTGDLSRMALRQQPGCHPIAADYTLEMMRAGQARGRLDWCAADAMGLPFAGQRFKVVVSGFLMRNVMDVPQALGEQYRMLKTGGRIVILDTTRPRRNWFWPLLWLHLHLVIPLLGWLISGQRAAYQYLPESSEHFLSAEELAQAMQTAGFTQVTFQRRMFGTIAIHRGVK